MTDRIFDYRTPQPSLHGYVRQFQIVGCRFPGSMKVLPVKAYWPRAETSLTFFPRDPEQFQFGGSDRLLMRPRSVVNGQFSALTNRYVGRDFMVFQVQFQPGALYRLTGIPVNLITNTFVDAEAVFGNEIRDINARLGYAQNHFEMIEIIEAFLLTLIQRARKPARPIDRVSEVLLARPDISRLDWLADQACLSQRQFYRLFVEREGVSPKMFARIARFENAMKLKQQTPRLDWLSIALNVGYTDYQHMVRDFKDFTAMTPNEFLQKESGAPERTFGKSEFSQ